MHQKVVNWSHYLKDTNKAKDASAIHRRAGPRVYKPSKAKRLPDKSIL